MYQNYSIKLINNPSKFIYLKAVKIYSSNLSGNNIVPNYEASEQKHHHFFI